MASAFLTRRGVEEARLEADLLVAHALELDRLGLLMKLDAPVLAAEVDLARDLLVRRGRREPVAYITGEREFYGRPFLVGPGALVPRPETELIVDLARAWWRARESSQGAKPLAVLDIGTGSGCLAATLALELSGAHGDRAADVSVLAVDRSPEALEWARRNVEALELTDRIELVCGDGLELAQERGPFDLVVSNPPYVNTAARESLAPDVRDYEPSLALFAPEGDADFWARELLGRVPQLLRPGGSLLVELGFDQSARVLAGAGPIPARMHADLAGVERVLEACRPGEDWPREAPRDSALSGAGEGPAEGSVPDGDQSPVAET